MTTASVVVLALWLSAALGATVFGVSLGSGAAPTWAVLRGVGAFALFMLIGLVAEAVTAQGLSATARGRAAQAPAEAPPAGAETRVLRPALEPEILSIRQEEEEAYDAA